MIKSIRTYQPRIVCVIHSKVRDAFNRSSRPDLIGHLEYGACGAIIRGCPSIFFLNYFPNGNAIPDEDKIRICERFETCFEHTQKACVTAEIKENNMLAKTHGVRLLAEEILGTWSPPYSEDIIEEVFLGIESHSGWMQRYQDLEADLTRHVVNSWMGKYVREIAGMEKIGEASAGRSRLINNYSKLRY